MQTPPALTTTAERFIRSLSGRNLSGHTVIAYQTDVTQFLTWLTDTDVTVDFPAAISRTHILDYLAHLAGMGRSGVTRARKLAAIREYFQFLVDEKSLPLSSAQKITQPKGKRKQRVFLRVDEYMHLLNATAGTMPFYRYFCRPDCGYLNWWGLS